MGLVQVIDSKIANYPDTTYQCAIYGKSYTIMMMMSHLINMLAYFFPPIQASTKVAL